MSRKVKSIRFRHYSPASPKKLQSAQLMSQKRYQAVRNQDIQSVIEDILDATHYTIRKSDQILQRLQGIYTNLQQNTHEYFFLKEDSINSQNLRCEEEPSPNIAPQAQLHKKQSDLQFRKKTIRTTSQDNIQDYQFQDRCKTIEKCKRERDLKKSCPNRSFIPLSQTLQRSSQEYTEQIQQLMRRKKQLFLEVANIRTNYKSKVISTERKQKKPFFHNDFGEAIQMNFLKKIHKVNTLVPINIKVHIGRSNAANLKKKNIVGFTNNRKTRKQIQRNVQDMCHLIEEIKENELGMCSEIHRAHAGLKSVRIKDYQQDLASALRLPTAY